MVETIKKRDGRIAAFNPQKITDAIIKCAQESGCGVNTTDLTGHIVGEINRIYGGIGEQPTVENIQDIVEKTLMQRGYFDMAKRYILYRKERTREREKHTHLMGIMDGIFNSPATENDLKRDNANTDTDTAMGTMLKIASEASKEFAAKRALKKEYADLHESGLIHIHDLDFLQLTTTCCQSDLEKLLKNGFSTGSGAIRPPNSIRAAAALVAIVLQANQNDQHGGQSISNFDWDLAPYVDISYQKHKRKNFQRLCNFIDDSEISEKIAFIEEISWQDTVEETSQAMEALVHNLNTMASRAGAQVPFSSINFGMDASKEGRLVSECLLKAQKAGIGSGDTAIFPILIFRVKDGVNGEPGDPNYDLFELACECAAARLFPCFAFLDAPFNLQYYKPDDKHTHVAYMGCRTRVIGNVYDPEREIVSGRGNLSFTSVNLPMLAIESGSQKDFFAKLESIVNICCDQLYDRYLSQRKRRVYNHPFLYGQGVWIDSGAKGWDDEIGDALNHGSLSVGFVGLAECLYALTGEHHGESLYAQELGLRIAAYMRQILDERAERTKLNYTLLATPAESYAGRALRLTREKHGVIEGVTDKEYFTNSFHIPPKYEVTIHKKIETEAPYHKYCNAGHITYVEMDGDMTKNITAFKNVIRYMKSCGIGYGAINVPLDKCGSCTAKTVIYDECPVCGEKESEGNKVTRIRRVTGYLVGTLDRFNDAKRAEEKDRVKHGKKHIYCEDNP